LVGEDSFVMSCRGRNGYYLSMDLDIEVFFNCVRRQYLMTKINFGGYDGKISKKDNK